MARHPGGRKGSDAYDLSKKHIFGAHIREDGGADMNDYTIAAIPTLYRGRQYRSRLEARWAAFFDLLEWRHEYEPYDLGAWSPDFLLPDWDVLVEVKPLEFFDQAVWDKAINACRSKGMLWPEGRDSPVPVQGIFLTRLAPARMGTPVQVGWFGLARNHYKPAPAYLCWMISCVRPTITADLAHFEPEGWWTAGGDADMWLDPIITAPKAYDDHTMELWARASNTVQWLGREARP